MSFYGKSAPDIGGGGGGGGGTGTVTSVALTATPASVFNVAGTPITTNGTLSLSMDTQTANQVLASATSGGAAVPAFRALVAGDIPSLPYLSSALTSAHIFVGNGSNLATDVAVTGDISLSNAGVTAYSGTLPNTKGGTGGDSSAGTGLAHVAAGTWSYSSLVNADVSASAAIAYSKLATLTSGNILVGSAGNVATSVAMSGDATIIASGALTIGNNAVSNAKLAQIATQTFKGRTTAATGNVEDLTVTQATAMLNVMVGDSGSGGTKGLVPAPGVGDATKFLRGDGTFASTTSPGLTNGHILVGNASNLATDVAMSGDIGITNAGVTSITSGVIVNADVNASAAIVYSKLSLTGSILNADVNASAAIAYSKLALTGGIVNADINASAAIATSKIALVVPTVQTFLSGTAQTYTKPAGVLYLKVRGIGGGGGGAGAGTAGADGGVGGTGGTTTFGSSLLTGVGGTGGARGGTAPAGGGGTASVTTSGTVLQVAALTGGAGGSGMNSTNVTTNSLSGQGGNGYFGGGGGGVYAGAANAGASNTGGGGGGGAASTNLSADPGCGGGAGGYFEAIITSPSSTYTYTVGAAGAAGTAGTNGTVGGAGGSGIIIVEEYYQ